MKDKAMLPKLEERNKQASDTLSKGPPPFKQSIVISGNKVLSTAEMPLSMEFDIKEKIKSLEIHKPVYVNTVEDVKQIYQSERRTENEEVKDVEKQLNAVFTNMNAEFESRNNEASPEEKPEEIQKVPET